MWCPRFGPGRGIAVGTICRLLIASLIMLSFSCAHRSKEVDETNRPPTEEGGALNEITEPEYVILSVVLTDLADGGGSGDSSELELVIVNVTAVRPGPPGFVDCKAYTSYGDVWPYVDDQTFTDFVLNSQFQHELKAKFEVPFAYKVLALEDARAFFVEGGGGWDAFYEEYPEMTGITELSRPGVNADSSEALVYAGRQIWDLYGYGYYYRLLRDGEQWKIRQKSRCWVS